MPKFKKGSPEAKAAMADIRARKANKAIAQDMHNPYEEEVDVEAKHSPITDPFVKQLVDLAELYLQTKRGLPFEFTSQQQHINQFIAYVRSRKDTK